MTGIDPIALAIVIGLAFTALAGFAILSVSGVLKFYNSYPDELDNEL